MIEDNVEIAHKLRRYYTKIGNRCDQAQYFFAPLSGHTCNETYQSSALIGEMLILISSRTAKERSAELSNDIDYVAISVDTSRGEDY